MERIATDTFSFERLRTSGFVYVDKTAILKTVADGSIGTQFFIARTHGECWTNRGRVDAAFDAERRNLSDRKVEVVERPQES